MTTLQNEIEQRLATEQPQVEVLLAEVVGGSTLRIYIDHPKGVTLALCEQITTALADLHERYALEVSSPGVERPLTKPDHFRRFVGRREHRLHVRDRGTAEHPDPRLLDLGSREPDGRAHAL